MEETGTDPSVAPHGRGPKIKEEIEEHKRTGIALLLVETL